jgi:GNAT superfamily N-acetyltransferase
LERDVGFLAYQDEKPVGFARLTASPDSAFAGLWGGGVLENFRSRGVYRALLAARIAEAKTRPGVRFLRVDALPTSQPILEKYGFVSVAKTWPCNWPAN